MGIETAQMARSIARHFFKLSMKLGDYRFEHWDELGEDELDNLESLESRLRNYSSKFAAMAVNMTMDELVGPLSQIHEATNKAGEAFEKLNQVGEIIHVAKKAVTLGLAIIARDVDKIKNASAQLLKVSTV